MAIIEFARTAVLITFSGDPEHPSVRKFLSWDEATRNKALSQIVLNATNTLNENGSYFRMDLAALPTTETLAALMKED